MGELCQNIWQDQNGQTRSRHFIKVSELDLPTKSKENAEYYNYKAQQMPANYNADYNIQIPQMQVQPQQSQEPQTQEVGENDENIPF